jgi:hypothetical protein
MYPKQMTKQVIEFNKKAFDNTFDAMTALQDQVEKVMRMFLDQSPWFPEEGKKVIGEWVKAYQKGRNDFKEAVDTNYKKVEAFFAE